MAHFSDIFLNDALIESLNQTAKPYVTNSGSQSKISAGRISLYQYQPLDVVSVLFQDDYYYEKLIQ